MSGFDNLKDFLNALFITFVLFGLGVWLPARTVKLRAEQIRGAFVKLLCRKLEEMTPRESKKPKEETT